MPLKIITTIVLSLFIADAISPAFAGGMKAPRLDWRCTLVLSPAMKNALKDYDPDFKVWEMSDFIPTLVGLTTFTTKASLSSVIADFNGDGILDAALMGRNKTNSMLIVLLSSGKKYQVKVVEKRRLIDPKTDWLQVYAGEEGKEYGLWSCLRFFKKSKVKSEVEKKTIELKNDAFTYNAFEKGGALYYYDDKTDSFKNLVISD